MAGGRCARMIPEWTTLGMTPTYDRYSASLFKRVTQLI